VILTDEEEVSAACSGKGEYIHSTGLDFSLKRWNSEYAKRERKNHLPTGGNYVAASEEGNRGRGHSSPGDRSDGMSQS